MLSQPGARRKRLRMMLRSGLSDSSHGCIGCGSSGLRNRHSAVRRRSRASPGPIFGLSHQPRPHRIHNDVALNCPEVTLVADETIPILPLPDWGCPHPNALGSPHPSAALVVIDEPRRIVLPRQHDLSQRDALKRLNQYMAMVRHDNPCQQVVTLPIKTMPRIDYAGCDFWFLQHTGAVTRVKIGLDPSAQMPHWGAAVPGALVP